MLIEQSRNQQVTDAHWVGRLVAPVKRSRFADRAGPRILGVGDIADKLAEKPPTVKVVNKLLGPCRHVIEPTHALVALRAVGRHAVKIALLRPSHERMNAIEQRIIAFKLARSEEHTSELQSLMRNS